MRVTISYKHGQVKNLHVGLSEQQFFAQYLPAMEGDRWMSLPVIGGCTEIFHPENVANISLSDMDEDTENLV